MATLTRLANAHLITTDRGSGRPLVPPQRAVSPRSLPVLTLNREVQRHLRYLPRFVCALLQTPSSNHLPDIAQRLTRRHQVFQEPISLETLTDLARAHCYLRPFFYSARDACLRDSLRLIEFLATRRIAATLIIGVRTQPFAAHAWVESAGYVLNDQASRVNQFTPLVLI